MGNLTGPRYMLARVTQLDRGEQGFIMLGWQHSPKQSTESVRSLSKSQQ